MGWRRREERGDERSILRKDLVGCFVMMKV